MKCLILALLLAAQAWAATSYGNEYGTGERRRLILITASSGIIGGGTLNWWVDGTTGVQTSGYFAATTVADKYVTFDFGEPVIVDEAKWYQSTTASHGTWKWRGATDCASYSDIGSSFTLGGALTQTQTAMNGNATAYRCLQIYGLSGTASSAPRTYEVEFKTQITRTNGTSYSNTGGMGNRSAVITATATNNLVASNQAAKLVDGTYGTDATFGGGTDVTGKYIRFDFGVNVGKLIDNGAFWQSIATPQATWKWQGSRDCSSFEDIGGNFSLGGDTITIMRTLNGNTKGYRCYQMLGVSGTVSSTPYMQEMEFRITDAPLVNSSSHPYIM